MKVGRECYECGNLEGEMGEKRGQWREAREEERLRPTAIRMATYCPCLYSGSLNSQETCPRQENPSSWSNIVEESYSITE